MNMRTRVLVSSVIFGAAGLGIAQEKAPQGPSKTATPPSAEGTGTVTRAPRRESLAATLVAFDVEKGTITFTNEAGETLTWPIETRLAEAARGYAQQRMQTLKEGDRIGITYIMEPGRGPRVYDVKPRRSGARSGSDQ